MILERGGLLRHRNKFFHFLLKTFFDDHSLLVTIKLLSKRLDEMMQKYTTVVREVGHLKAVQKNFQERRILVQKRALAGLEDGTASVVSATLNQTSISTYESCDEPVNHNAL